MSVVIGNKTYYNLEEQVMENKKNISELQSSVATKEYVDNGIAAAKDNTNLTGTTHAENIIVSGDAVIDSLEVQTSITVPIPVNTYDAVNKGYVDGKIINIMTYKGSKTNYSDLPASGNAVGDVWNVINAYSTYPAGTNFAWSGVGWDPLGAGIDLSQYRTASAQDALDAALSNRISINANNIANKLDKISTAGIYGIYGINNGNQTTYNLSKTSSQLYANYIVQRDTNGQVNVPITPTADNHATSKKYSDDTFATKTDLQQGLATKETTGVCYTKSETNSLLATKSVVSGNHSGGNWTSITINGVSKYIPDGGGGTQLYEHRLKSGSTVMLRVITTSSTAISWNGVGGYEYSGSLISIPTYYDDNGTVYYNVSGKSLQVGPSAAVLRYIYYFDEGAVMDVYLDYGWTDTVVAL